MNTPLIDLSSLRKALEKLIEAIQFWQALADEAPLKPHLRSSVIQSFEFSYELSVRAMRRVLIERSESADLIRDLSFNDLLRSALDAGFPIEINAWRRWREMRNGTSHAYDEERAQAVALESATFAKDATLLLDYLYLTNAPATTQAPLLPELKQTDIGT